MSHHPHAVNRAGEISIPVNKKAVIEFFGELSANAAVLLEASVDDVPDLPTPLSVSTLTGYRSALVDLYRQHGKSLDRKLDVELNSVLNGYEKVICALKQGGRMAINEGKRHLKWSGYVMLAKKFMTRAPSGSSHGPTWSSIVFGWAFFVIMWNLMSRSESVDKLMLQHIDWDGDALIIEEQGHKGDQTGENRFGKHVFAHPESPEKCPVLAVGILFFLFQIVPMANSNSLQGPTAKTDLENYCNEFLVR